jgi:hypothetical protein
MTMQAAEHLKASIWKHPDSYAGFSPDGDYCILSKHRESELLDRINWDVACESLDAEPYDGGYNEFEMRPTVYHWRARHWAVGWIEYLMVRADAPEPIKTKSGEILCSLADYPYLDEDRHSEAELNAVCDYWGRCSVGERVSYLQDAKRCIFAARRDELPEDSSNGGLYERLSTGL